MNPSDRSVNTTSFLPDFCALRMVFGVVVLSELFAFILVLAGSTPGNRWNDLALTSLFVQWAGLLGAALLCLGRRVLRRLGDIAAGVVGYLLLLVVIAGLSEVAFGLLAVMLPGPAPDRWDFIGRNLAIGAIVTGIMLRYFYVAQQWKQQVEAESSARFNALQARIRPHFLFNTLNTAAALVHDRPDTAESALEDLADLFRATLKESRALVSLADEVELVRRYVAIEQLRIGERLTVQWHIDPAAEALGLPPLSLQPLVENAVYHGIEPLAGGGTVVVSAECRAGCLWLAVENPRPSGRAHPSGDGNRMALANIRQRLAARFGDRADVRIDEGETVHRVTLVIPETEVEQ